MYTEQYPSRLLETAVQEFSKLPGIGRRTALRLVINLLRRDTEDALRLSEAIARVRTDVKHCSVCHNISDTEICPICSDQRRDASVVCVVENIQDVLAVEDTEQYHGLYHVLGGLISPMDGVGPSDIEIASLIERVAKGDVREIILALSPTMEGDTTNFYIYRRLEAYDVKVTEIARGVAVGEDLGNTDEVTLGRSILNRVPFESPYSSLNPRN